MVPTPHATLAPLLARHAGRAHELLPLLHALQDSEGYVDPAHVPAIATALNLSRAEVHGVITFYHHFRSTPPAATVVQICRAEACRSRDGEALVAHVEACTGARIDGDPCSGVAVESVYCLGQCALSPAMIVNGELHARVTPARFDAVLASVAVSGGKEGRHD
ncbi:MULTISPECIES: NAD(P)H-dependent oxidoreductase subunit E [Pandoraea]|uniref:NAD(P)H-dependent oxidoreductase subunit E n=1 Tax=Pandoraea TaxID=93217 RepID=UPI001F5D1F33|nr:MULTISPECIES: NAD(P)H-dependent oxidoreductase subunit E [Pandoraea]MCI3208204.1 formate dehydrogenase [Pandoraea sp. LA3]MDN4586233.1 formate dehydrogenase [Pandoraea capi]